jgi:vancomycin resistance protein YoaR
MSESALTKSYNTWLIVFLAIFFILLITPLITYIIYENLYHNRIYSGVYIGQTHLGGLTRERAKLILNQKIDAISQNGIPFHYHNQSTVLFPLIASLEGDIAIEIFSFDTEKTIDKIFQYGRQGSFIERLKTKLLTWAYHKNFFMLTSLDEEEVKNFLSNNFSHFTTPAENASLIYQASSPYGVYSFSVAEEKYGQTLDYDKALTIFRQAIASLEPKIIKLEAMIDYPNIYKKNIDKVDEKANYLLNNAPITINYGYYKWNINKPDLAEWLLLKQSPATNTEKIVVGPDNTQIFEYLKDFIAPQIEIEPVEAKFEVKNGRVVEFQASRGGRKLEISESIDKIETAIIYKQDKVELAVKEIESDINTSDINDYGIKKIIGIGQSSFAGSPANRRHNIALGASTLNGILIEPNEEFSLINYLGEIDAAAGYLPELVIKEGKTIPEYGGGLCQIGTTIFRATTDSGLPVTMRRNHSFRVRYYEPAGTDATIYNPWPDYRFINDTGKHVLVQTEIDGDDLYFKFWGTDDGRIATQTKPVVYNIVAPPPTKIIETLDLAPGEKKCTEHAVSGADAYFDYRVEYPNSEIKETRFKSHYVPWREVCLLGVEELSQESVSATSTPSST